MIPYQIYHQIKDMAAQGLCAAQIATSLHLDPRTVGRHLQAKRFCGAKKNATSEQA